MQLFSLETLRTIEAYRYNTQRSGYSNFEKLLSRIESDLL